MLSSKSVHHFLYQDLAQQRWLALWNMLLAFLTLVASWVSPTASAAPANDAFSIPYLKYYCNADHIDAAKWKAPPRPRGFTGSMELIHVTTSMRHHKRAPANLIPNENQFNQIPWDCSGVGAFTFATSDGQHGHNAPRLSHVTDVPAWHAFLPNFWNGTCQQGQLTPGGLQDSINHGKALGSVYLASHRGLQKPFLSSINPRDVYVRTSTEERTHHVASGVLIGMDPRVALKDLTVHIQPAQIDSLVPSYPCPRADAIRNAFQSVPAWTKHLDDNVELKARLDAVLGTAGMSAWSSWYDHFFDVLTSRLCHNHPLPCNPKTGACVTTEDAAKVFDIGDAEYNYIWNEAENASLYNSLTYGVMFHEYALNMKAIIEGTEPYKFRLYSGHDGGMVRLASGLGFAKPAANGKLHWPALGSEIIFEVWSLSQAHQKRELFVRVLNQGAPVRSLEWVPADDFLALLESNVPANLFQTCNS